MSQSRARAMPRVTGYPPGAMAPHTSLTGQSINDSRPHWSGTCPYCGVALPKTAEGEPCPTEIIDRAAGAVKEDP